MLKQRIEQDLKTALLAGDKVKVTTLRGLKSVILYAEVAKGIRGTGLPDEEILVLFAKEAKKRQESADLYKRGGNTEKYEAELAEKALIQSYLPAQLSDQELEVLVEQVIAEMEPSGLEAMGQVIATVKQRSNGPADGARIAQLVREKLHQ